jgi:hypothetical protein
VNTQEEKQVLSAVKKISWYELNRKVTHSTDRLLAGTRSKDWKESVGQCPQHELSVRRDQEGQAQETSHESRANCDLRKEMLLLRCSVCLAKSKWHLKLDVQQVSS